MKRGNSRFAFAVVVFAGIGIASCSISRPSFRPNTAPIAEQPVQSTMIAKASWYGPGFNGHRTASGEIYNQEEMTAASTVIPIGSHVIVTNLDNGRSVEVRINDHGPYVKGRKIDLSHGAARALGIVKPGTARVRIDVVSQPRGTRRIGTAIRYYVQVGSYSQSANAQHVSDTLANYYNDVRIDEVSAGRRSFYRVRMGSFLTRAEARERANESARFGYPMVVVSE